ncbi:CBASS cGAMP synthase [Bradyrhizobium yuanmingense]|uniref:CBASS cGAMP synthase n=1 Tax=Bradyrhizobium yuanmingense TaxID=108015 RepID=UPI0021A3B719|nr:CBASS cGAMP synthase [Bradyrhizobium sp. CB1024]UWU82985.1 CBASS cGAMP synthase [Bradyrhizobium sp. CB1024]
MGIAASLFYNTDEPEISPDWRVRPSDEQYNTQQERWNDLAIYLRDDLAKRSDCAIAWWLQGSYKFGTQIRPASPEEEFDIDVGIYFQWAGEPDDGKHSPLDLKTFVQESLVSCCDDDGNDASEVEDPPKAQCSRVHFDNSFHIDVPSYHLDSNRDARALATAENEWENSDPKAIYGWWKDAIPQTDRPRCRRLVRYFKMWAALRFGEGSRPSSILLTVLVGDAFEELDKDELSGEDDFLTQRCGSWSAACNDRSSSKIQ